jgi:hypothetical protein
VYSANPQEAFRVAFGLGDEGPIMRPREHRIEIW